MYETSTSILLPKPQRNPQSEDSGSDTSTQIYTAILAIAPRDLISRKRIYLAQTATVEVAAAASDAARPRARKARQAFERLAGGGGRGDGWLVHVVVVVVAR